MVIKMTTDNTEDVKESAVTGGAEAGEANEGERRLPPPDFTTFVYSLSTSALMQLGEIENPETGRKQTNFQLAKHTIDLLEMLKEKTENNLTEEENKLMEGVLYDLRSCYCKVKG